jgi:transforming growth factor-beta-induced protein
MKKFGFWLLLGVLTLVLTACPAATDEDEDDITDIAGDTANLSTLVDALTKAGLVDELQADGPFTVFAPTNEAFTALLAAEEVADLDALIAKLGAEAVEDILLYHVVSGERRAASLEDGDELTTLQGETIAVSVAEGTVTLNGSATVTTADVGASNGVIHLIDAVLLPPSLTPEEPDIVELASANADLSILVAALTEAELVATLQGEGPFTVFAPTNAAFEALLAELEITQEELLAREDLAAILTYHVASGEVLADDLSDGQTIPTVQGEDIVVDITEGVVTLNGIAGVTATDIQASNGVVHLIDAVLLPPAAEPVSAELSLSGANEVPPISPPNPGAFGSAIVTLDGRILTVDATYAGFEATAAHVHGPATEDETAGVVNDVTLDFTYDAEANEGTVTGELVLTDPQIEEFNSGLYYLNVHSEDNPTGEIRGQIVPPTVEE